MKDTPTHTTIIIISFLVSTTRNVGSAERGNDVLPPMVRHVVKPGLDKLCPDLSSYASRLPLPGSRQSASRCSAHDRLVGSSRGLPDGLGGDGGAARDAGGGVSSSALASALGPLSCPSKKRFRLSFTWQCAWGSGK